MTRRREIRRSGFEATLNDAEATVELPSSILRQLTRQENALLELTEEDGDADAVMKKRLTARTEAGEALRTALTDILSGRSSKSSCYC